MIIMTRAMARHEFFQGARDAYCSTWLFDPDPYDINWTFPLYEEAPKSERINIKSFVPSLRALEYVAQVTAHPDLHCRYPSRSPRSSCVHRNLTWILFAIVGKGARRCSGGGNWSAGASVHNLSLEIGWVVLAFQRTYVISKHIRHVERGRDIAPVRPLAVRSRYQTRRARNPPRALDGRHMLRIFRRMSWRWVWG